MPIGDEDPASIGRAATTALCPTCGHTWQVGPDDTEVSFCPNCGAVIWLGKTKIQVQGRDASEVSRVTREVLGDVSERREAERLRSPWISGTFYLAALVVVVTLLLVAGRAVSPWALPIVIVGAVLLISVIGALQLRQDDRLSERGFLALMRMSLARLPLLLRSPGKTQEK